MKPATLSRRDCLLFAAGCASVPANARAVKSSALSGFYYRDYSRCLPEYISGLARTAYEKRRRALALLTTSTAIRRRQAWTRDILWKIIGGTPERTPLNDRVVGRFERAAYAVEKVVYESRPGLVVSANLYLPKTGKPPYPGVLFQMGHAANGKAYAPYQKCCQGLAQLGYMVLAFDPMGQGERIGYPDASGTRSRLASADEEHSLPGKQLLLLGDSATRYQLWDAIRSLDYLASHRLVDKQRLASTGQSGGGTISMLLACVEDRLRTVVICSGNTENLASAHFNPPGATDDAEQNLINSGPFGFDRWDLLYPLAPKPLLVQVSAHDFFGTYSPSYLDDGQEQFEQLARCYGVLGHRDQLAWRSTPLPHGLTYAFRLDVYNWFERWLKDSTRTINEEPAVKPEKDETLRVGATGNVARDYASLRPFEVIQRAVRSVVPSNQTRAWEQALPVLSPDPHLQFRKLATTPLAGVDVTASEVHSSAAVWIPAWLFLSNKPDPRRSSLLVLDDHGRNAHAHEDDLYHGLARAGRLVCAADLRGMGDMRPEVGRGNPGYTISHDSDEDYAWTSLILGEPLLAQRMNDILALVRCLKNLPEASQRPIALAARGNLTVPALFAFAVSPEINSLYLAGGLISFRSVLDSEFYKQTLENFAWNLFRLTDLPQLAGQCGPRRIELAGAVDALQKTCPKSELRRLYPFEHVTISDGAAWDDQALQTL